MTPNLKLVYFDGRGVIEGTRFILKQGGIEFEDVRIKQEDWPKLKETTPLGQLPYLEHNGKQFPQSIAIARYAAKLAKLDGKNDLENLEIDGVVDALNDFRIKYIAARAEKDQEKQKELMQVFRTETFSFYMKTFDNLVQKNNGYLAANRLTWADLQIASWLPVFEEINADVFKQYKNLVGLIEKVNNLPAIKKWIETRPKTPF